MGLVEEDPDGFGRLRFLAFISRWQSIARPRESHGVIKRRCPPSRAGLTGNEGVQRDKRSRNDIRFTEGGVRRPPGPILTLLGESLLLMVQIRSTTMGQVLLKSLPQEYENGAVGVEGLDLNHVRVAVDFSDAEYALVETKRAFRVSGRQSHMRQPIRSDHVSTRRANRVPLLKSRAGLRSDSE